MAEHEMTVVIGWNGDLDETKLPVWLRACLAEWRQTEAVVHMPLGAVYVSNRSLTDAEMAYAETVAAAYPEWRKPNSGEEATSA